MEASEELGCLVHILSISAGKLHDWGLQTEGGRCVAGQNS